MTANALLGPDTVSWRVNHEPVVFMGGGRALLLQVAHPLVAAGVAQHSNYESDPWGRLYRTLDTTVKIVFGEPATAQAASKRLRRRHDRVQGSSDEGVPYDARDPALLLWVWATLVDTSLVLYERCFAPLSVAERERFYSEQKLFAYACGVPEGYCPATHAAFNAYVDDAVASDLHVGDAARAVAASVVRPALPAPLRSLAAPHNLLTAGLLPASLREQYGFAWSNRREHALGAWFGLVRAGVRIVPRRVRHYPVALTAGGRLRPPRWPVKPR
jgi:uncharacterized protein (DUF2236 family)